ncbi:MAG: DUF3362 domain-containing protein, partial [Oscillospiraceae bacterium]
IKYFSETQNSDNKFSEKFYKLTKQAGKKQYLVPYLMSSHPGSTLEDAVILAKYLYDNKIRPEQVQDFYPTPGTVSTCMFYTGLDPYTLKSVYVAKLPEEKAMQRALLQYYEPRNREKVVEALRKTGNDNLIPVLVGGGAATIRNKAQGAVLWTKKEPTLTKTKLESKPKPYRKKSSRK